MKVKSNRYIYLILLGVSLTLFIFYYPVTVFDMDTDQHYRANFLSALLGKYEFTNDYFMSNPRFFRNYTEIYLHLPFLKFFNDIESYHGVSHALYFLVANFLFYRLLFFFTGRRWFSLAFTIFIHSATYYFQSYDVFGFIPLWTNVGKTLSYLNYLLLLVVLWLSESRFKKHIVGAVVCSLTLWIHPFAFIGAALPTYLCWLFHRLSELPTKRVRKMKVLFDIFI